jgi:CAAX protease family protein
MATAENSLPSSSSLPAPGRATAVASFWHTLAFVIFLIGFAYLQTLPVVQKRAAVAPSRVPTYIATIIFELVLIGYVWLGVRLRKVTLRELIGGKWTRFADFLMDVAIALLFWIAVWIMLAAFTLLIKFNGQAAAKLLLPQTLRELGFFTALALIAGFCEELIFRGYLQRQFLALTGNTIAAVVLQGIVFGAAHLYQGAKGVLVISVYGMMFGTLAAIRKSLRPGMIQHGGQDAISGGVAYFLSKHTDLLTKHKIAFLLIQAVRR